MKLVFSVVPTQAPFLVRPLVSAICSGVVASFVDPELKKLMGFVQSELDKKGGGWFAGGDSEGNPVSSEVDIRGSCVHHLTRFSPLQSSRPWPTFRCCQFYFESRQG